MKRSNDQENSSSQTTCINCAAEATVPNTVNDRIWPARATIQGAQKQVRMYPR